MSSQNSNVPNSSDNAISTPKSSDPGWSHGYLKPEFPKNVFCKYCHKKLSGGVFRLKQHLTGTKLTEHGGKNNAGAICSSVPTTVTKKILDFQREFYKKRKDKDRVEKEILRHDSLMDSEEEAFGSGGQDDQEGLQSKESRGISISQKRARDKATYHFCQWMYEAGIPFNAVRHPSFGKIFEYVGQAGPDMKPPTYHEVRISFLDQKYKETKKFVEDFRVHWETYGCSVMSDGWTDGKHRTLINFLVNCPKGIVFLKSIDASEHVKSAIKLADLLGEVIEEVGVKNVVQLITDNASNYKAAGDILMNKYPTLYWSGCTAHCVDLILEDIGKLPKFSKIVKESQRLASFIYNRPRVLHLMRKKTDGKELVRPAVTRFGTNFLCLESIHSLKSGLEIMFVCDDWNKNEWSKKAEGKRMAGIVGRTSYWVDMLHCLKVLAPLVEVVRLVDAEEKPAMGYIYHAMARAKELIKKNLNDDPRVFMEYWEIVDHRWDEQLYQDLHAAGFYLNPQLYFEKGATHMESDHQTKRGLFNAISRMCCEDSDIEDKIYNQLVTYREARGMMGIAAAIRRRATTSPADWWLTFGSDAPELQKFAIRVLSQTVSSSPCERNWSTFDNLHTKKRNCLAQKKLNDLVYVQYNGRLRRRCEDRLSLRGKEMDPILLRDLDECNEWVAPLDDDLVFEGNDLTWRVVEEAMGTNEEVGPSTRRRTTQSQRQPMELIDEVDEVDDENPDDNGLASGDDEDIVGYAYD